MILQHGHYRLHLPKKSESRVFSEETPSPRACAGRWGRRLQVASRRGTCLPRKGGQGKKSAGSIQGAKSIYRSPTRCQAFTRTWGVSCKTEHHFIAKSPNDSKCTDGAGEVRGASGAKSRGVWSCLGRERWTVRPKGGRGAGILAHQEAMLALS